MPRDYKNSTQRKKTKKLGLDWWDGLLVLSFIVVASLFGVYFLDPAVPETTADLENILSFKDTNELQTANLSMPKLEQVVAKKQLTNNIMQNLAAKAQAKITQKAPKPVKQDEKPQEPRFDFYTILPSLEVIVPEHEIKARIREERLGTDKKKAIEKKGGKYIMQAGSFRDFVEAQRLRDKLIAMGVESRIEKAQVGEVVWNRIKIGPYSGMNTVMTIKTRLRNSGIDALVLEFKV